jgi:hypothetical protein
MAAMSIEAFGGGGDRRWASRWQCGPAVVTPLESQAGGGQGKRAELDERRKKAKRLEIGG